MTYGNFTIYSSIDRRRVYIFGFFFFSLLSIYLGAVCDREQIVDSGFKKRHRIEGDHLTHDFMKSNQFLLTAKNKTEARIICHFIGGVGVVDAAQSKVGFCLVTTPEGKHMEMSYQTSCVGCCSLLYSIVLSLLVLRVYCVCYIVIARARVRVAALAWG